MRQSEPQASEDMAYGLKAGSSSLVAAVECPSEVSAKTERSCVEVLAPASASNDLNSAIRARSLLGLAGGFQESSGPSITSGVSPPGRRAEASRKAAAACEAAGDSPYVGPHSRTPSS